MTDPKTFPCMDDNGNGYPNTTKWDLEERQPEDDMVYFLDQDMYFEDEGEWDNHTENEF